MKKLLIALAAMLTMTATALAEVKVAEAFNSYDNKKVQSLYRLIPRILHFSSMART